MGSATSKSRDIAGVWSPTSRCDRPCSALGENSMPIGTSNSCAVRTIEAIVATSWAFSWATIVFSTGYSSSASWKSMATSTFWARIICARP